MKQAPAAEGRLLLGADWHIVTPHPTDFLVFWEHSADDGSGHGAHARRCRRIRATSEAERDAQLLDTSSDAFHQPIFLLAATGEELELDETLLLTLTAVAPEGFANGLARDLKLELEGALGAALRVRMTPETTRDVVGLCEHLNSLPQVDRCEAQVMLRHELYP